METSVARILLAISSPLVRVRLRHVLVQDPSVRLVGEATDGAQAAQQTRECEPQVILCDERMLADPSVQALFAPRRGPIPYRLVVIAANTRAVNRSGPVPIAAVLPIDLPTEELGQQLHLAMRVSMDLGKEAPPTRVVGLENRFVNADDFRASAASPQIQGTGMLTDNQGLGARTPAQGLSRAPGQPMTLRTTRVGGVSRRKTGPAQDQLSAILMTIQGDQAQQRDTITGLANTRALGNALRTLPTINHPAAVVVVDLWYAPGHEPPSDIGGQHALMRATGAILRANARQDDLICRLDGMTFAIVMPGVDAGTIGTPLTRLRNALERMRQTADGHPQLLSVAFGVGFWVPGLPPALPLERGWQEMIAARAANGRA